MIGLVGIVIIFVMVFGGYTLAGGKMGLILKALPFEMIMIGGAAVGAFVISNDMAGIKHTLKDMGKVFKGTKWKAEDYRDLLCLLFELIRIARANPVGLETHIEEPDSRMIGGALVGTFLGVFLAYGLVGPFAGKVKTVVEEDAHFYQLIREVLVANLYQHAPNICIEVGRQNTPGHCRPSFSDLEEALKAAKQDAA